MAPITKGRSKHIQQHQHNIISTIENPQTQLPILLYSVEFQRRNEDWIENVISSKERKKETKEKVTEAEEE